MKKLIYCSLLGFAFCLSTLVRAQVDFGNLLQLAQSNPDSLVSLSKGNKMRINVERKTFLLCLAYQVKADYSKVDSLLNIALTDYAFDNDSGLYVNYLMVSSDQYKFSGNYEAAITTLLKAVNCSERNLDTINMVTTSVHLAETARAAENFELGLAYLEKAELAVKNFGRRINLIMLARIYDRKASIFIEMKKDFDETNEQILNTISIAAQIGDKNLEASSYNNLGFLYINKEPENPNKKAEDYFKKAIELYDELGNSINATNARINLSRYYNRKGEYQMGVNTLIAIKRVVDSSDWLWEKGGYYEMLGRLYFSLKEYKSAYESLEIAKLNLIELTKNQYDKRIASLEIQHKIAQKEKEIQLAMLETKAKKNENKILYIILFFVFLLAISFFIFLIISGRQKRILRKQQKENIEINKKLTKVVAQKETLLSEVNHRVKNNLSILSGLLYLQQTKELDPNVKSAIKKSLDRINTISLIHESIYKRDDMESVDFQEYLARLIHSNKEIYWNDLPLEIDVQCNKLSPNLETSVPLAMIINELVTNSFKYAFKGISSPKIKVVFENGVLKYMDNGKGVESGNSNTNLGSKLISIFSDQINATINSFADSQGYHHHIRLSND